MYEYKPIAVVAFGAILPDAPDASLFWQNILNSTYSISKVPASRWQSELYYDPDPRAPDKTYSNIGGFVKNYAFEPMKWRIPIPPLVQQMMDHPQKWAIAITRQLLMQYGVPERDVDRDRTAVILGNSMSGELHYKTTMRIRLPEFLKALEAAPSFQSLPSGVQQVMLEEAAERFTSTIPPITEDTMPGELPNIIAGRIANIFNFRGPNFVTDAACASSFAALQSAVEGLNTHRFNAAITGGMDAGMGVEAYIKFCKVGALSPDGSRPYDAGANGFVMGEGGVGFLLKRLEDAERDGDQIYAVLRGIGSSSDGKGKGITAPNPIGQITAVQRAWRNAGLNPASVGLIEGHGTSTRVGDVVEVNCLEEAFREFNLPKHSIALGSVKSNIGHLKSGAGAAGMLKAVLALHEKILPPSVNFNTPNPNINFDQIPFYVNTLAKPWEVGPGEIRRAGVSAFGFGGTNFHLVLEEYVPGTTLERGQVFQAAKAEEPAVPEPALKAEPASAVDTGASAVDDGEIRGYILAAVSEKTGYPVEMLDPELDLEADLGVDTVKQAELFVLIREHFGIPRRDDLVLSDYNTLEKVIRFVRENSGTAEKAGLESSPEMGAIEEESERKQDEESVINLLVAAVSEKTGYPEDMLDLDLDLEADLGVDTVKQAELLAGIREHYGIPRRDDLVLADYNTLRKVAAFVLENSQPGDHVEAQQASEPVVEEPASLAYDGTSHTPVRGLLFLSAETRGDLVRSIEEAVQAAKAGVTPARTFPEPETVALPERIAVDFEDASDLASKGEKALKALAADNPKIWLALGAQGIRHGSGDPGKLVFMFPGQGSQYVNMLRDLLDLSPEVRDTFAEADAVTTPIFGRPLTDYIFVDGDERAFAQAKENLRDTTITQPAVLTCNVALSRMLKSFGYEPDMVVGHSLGEYAALVEAGILSFSNALKVVSVRGQEMSKVAMDDNGCMAAVNAPIEQVRETLAGIEGYVVLANLNSPKQAVIGGATPAVDRALAVFNEAGINAVKIPVSHGFHTRIVEPASLPLRIVIDRMEVNAPGMPIVANVTGDWYPTDRDAILDVLADQVTSPVQFIDCMETLYQGGGRTFIEVGPKRVLSTLAMEIFAGVDDVQISSLNHPRKGGLASFNQALCALLAAGIAPHQGQTAERPAEKEQQALSRDVDESSVVEVRLSGVESETPEESTPAVQPLEVDSVKAYCVNLLSEKTGYPAEMLDLDLDLEAELGIDTVKQAELFAELREHYHLARREDLLLSDYNTLRKVIDFMKETTTSSDAGENSTGPSQQKEELVKEDQLEVKLIRRVPRPVLRPKLDLCLPTGLTFSSGDTVLLVGDQGNLTGAFKAYLVGLQVNAVVCSPDSALDQMVDGSIKGIFFLAGLDKLGHFESLELKTLQNQLERQVYALYHLMRNAKDLKFLVAITQSDGLHGYGSSDQSLSLKGGISGFCKSLAREDDSLLVKVVDFESGADPAWMAEKAISEVTSDPAVVEVGWHGAQRWTIAALPEDRLEDQDLELGADSVFLISGGAGGISVPIARDMAVRTRGTFILLGRTDLPDEDDPNVKQALSDRAGLKKRLIAEAASQKGAVTPKQIEKQLHRYEQQGRILQVLEGIRSAGAQAEYIACNVIDAAAVQQTVSDILEAHGKVDVFIHAAGVEKSRKLTSKTLEEFQGVVEVKVLGFYNLYHTLRAQNANPQAVQVFSSVAGRFGNAGQTDYAAANDLLCRWMMVLAKECPDVKFQALDWSAWAEVGMATRGFIPRVMAQAGIEMLPTKVAAPQVWHELTQGSSGEVIMAGSLGVLEKQTDLSGGMDVPAANETLRVGGTIHTMFGKLTGWDIMEGIILEADLDPKSESILHDHAINGTPILPGVMGIEGFADAASNIASVLGTEGPAFNVSLMRQIRFETPLKFFRREPRHITWKARVLEREGEMIAEVKLSSILHTQLGETKASDHFSGQVVLEPTPILQPENWGKIPEWDHAEGISKDKIYLLSFYGPSFQVLEGVQRRDEFILGKMGSDFTSGSNPLMQLTSHPMLIELCFQTVGVFEIGSTGEIRLPKSVGALRIYPNQVNRHNFYAFVKPRTILEDQMAYDAWVVDQDGKIYLEMRDYRTVLQSNELDASFVAPFRKALGFQR